AGGSVQRCLSDADQQQCSRPASPRRPINAKRLLPIVSVSLPATQLSSSKRSLMIGSSRHTPDIQRIEPRAAKQSVEQRERAVTSAATASAAMLGAKTSKLRQEGSYSTSAQCNGIGTEGV